MDNLERAAMDFSSKVIDPVCGMSVDFGLSKLVSVYQGRSYFFCAEVCRDAFDANPKKYLERKPGKKKGVFGRFFDRMAKANRQQFGCSGPKCH